MFQKVFMTIITTNVVHSGNEIKIGEGYGFLALGKVLKGSAGMITCWGFHISWDKYPQLTWWLRQPKLTYNLIKITVLGMTCLFQFLKQFEHCCTAKLVRLPFQPSLYNLRTFRSHLDLKVIGHFAVSCIETWWLTRFVMYNTLLLRLINQSRVDTTIQLLTGAQTPWGMRFKASESLRHHIPSSLGTITATMLRLTSIISHNLYL